MTLWVLFRSLYLMIQAWYFDAQGQPAFPDAQASSGVGAGQNGPGYQANRRGLGMATISGYGITNLVQTATYGTGASSTGVAGLLQGLSLIHI